MKKCDFTHKHYKEIIDLAKKKGYIFSDFFQKEDAKKRIYMRHDVDISLDSALEMAEIEKKEGIKTTYLVMLSAPYYNIFYEKYRKIIERIGELGHDIGIHYDWRIESKKQVADNLIKQYGFLNSLSLPIKKVVSFHRPSKKLIGKTFSRFISTYEPDFFIKTKYISDSNRKWREGCPCQFLESSSYQNLQVLTHSIWWNEKKLSYSEIYRKLEKERIRDIKTGLVSDVSAYKKLFKNS